MDARFAEWLEYNTKYSPPPDVFWGDIIKGFPEDYAWDPIKERKYYEQVVKTRKAAQRKKRAEYRAQRAARAAGRNNNNNEDSDDDQRWSRYNSDDGDEDEDSNASERENDAPVKAGKSKQSAKKTTGEFSRVLPLLGSGS